MLFEAKYFPSGKVCFPDLVLQLTSVADKALRGRPLIFLADLRFCLLATQVSEEVEAPCTDSLSCLPQHILELIEEELWES